VFRASREVREMSKPVMSPMVPVSWEALPLLAERYLLMFISSGGMGEEVLMAERLGTLASSDMLEDMPVR
jgi:hypothetical protein